ncbi:hypothetical protein [Piscibacillus salipiscarius]|uniref:DUF3139 domain-containing protein n=1 Tax=Piscibacillus salipiscarius TaxID=299480 RepID=A0ABW5Q9U6_9BACI|nr:hypothetical protein [Piscibacillus salipiscarius]
MKKLFSITTIMIVAIIGLFVWFQSQNQTWAFEYVNLDHDNLPLSEKHALTVASRHVEGRINTYLPNQESPWDTPSGVNWSDELREEIDVVTDKEDHFVVEFRHRGDFCDQKFVYVKKKTGHVINVQNGYSKHEACE